MATGAICRCRCLGSEHGSKRVGVDKQFKLFSELPAGDPHYRPKDECDDSPIGKHQFVGEGCRYCNQPKNSRSNGSKSRAVTNGRRKNEIRLFGWITDEDTGIGLSGMRVEIAVRDFRRHMETVAGGYFSFGIKPGSRVRINCIRMDLDTWITMPSLDDPIVDRTDPNMPKINLSKLIENNLECPSN